MASVSVWRDQAPSYDHSAGNSCIFGKLCTVADLQKIQSEREPEKSCKDKDPMGRGDCCIYCYCLSHRQDHLCGNSLSWNAFLENRSVDESEGSGTGTRQFFEDGVEGVLTDLDNALDMPEELYLVNQYQMTFDENGKIKTIYTFLYGQDKNGETQTYLVDYDESRSQNMTVRVNGNATTDYTEDKRLEPMLTILREASCEERVQAWAEADMGEEFEILYMGRRSFSSAAGLEYLPGDVDGDGTDAGTSRFDLLNGGGEILGFEVSLHIPDAEDVIPVRYIMEPEYISQEILDEEQEEQQTETAKEAKTWSVDNTDGTMYFFLNDDQGWRLVVADAAAGSRFYQMEKTEDGGTAWTMSNEDPFGGQIGVTEGLIFFDENLGFAGLTGASQSYSSLYMTGDGGETFTQVQLPMDSVSQIPESGTEYGFTVSDYDYIGQENRTGSCFNPQTGEQPGLMRG